MRKLLFLLPILLLAGCGSHRISDIRAGHSDHGVVVHDVRATPTTWGVLVIDDLAPSIDPVTGAYSCPLVRYEALYDHTGLVLAYSRKETR